MLAMLFNKNMKREISTVFTSAKSKFADAFSGMTANRYTPDLALIPVRVERQRMTSGYRPRF